MMPSPGNDEKTDGIESRDGAGAPPSDASESPASGPSEADGRPPGGAAGGAVADDLEEMRRKASQYDRLLRALAEAENRCKRVEREAERRVRYAAQELLNDLLPVFDDVARAKQACAEVPAAETVLEGLRLVETHLVEALARHGITPIPTHGQRFDPQRHEAVAVVYSDQHPESSVVEEVQRGWQFEDRILRAAKVVVNVGRPEGGEDADSPGS